MADEAKLDDGRTKRLELLLLLWMAFVVPLFVAGIGLFDWLLL